MTLEYLLLMGIFVGSLYGVLLKVPSETFKESGPRLAARVEKSLVSGNGFVQSTQISPDGVSWRKSNTPNP